MDFQDRVALPLRIKVDLNDVKAALFALLLAFGKVAFCGLCNVLLLFMINCSSRLRVNRFAIGIKLSRFNLDESDIFTVLDDQINFASQSREVFFDNAITAFSKKFRSGFFAEIATHTAEGQRLHESRNFRKDRR